MHVALFTDLHPATIGGAQISVASQRRALENLGHTVTVFSAPLGPGPDPDPCVVELRPVPVLSQLARVLGKYDDFVFVWPTRANADIIDEALAVRPAVDIVHVQGDLGVAVAGVDAARRHGIPVVQTKHSRYDAYLDQATSTPAFLALVLSRMHTPSRARDFTLTPRQESTASRLAWQFMVAHAQSVDHVIAPTTHFARALIDRGVNQPVSAISNGIDDELLDDLLHNLGGDLTVPARAGRSADGEPLRLIWCGRLSAEKRVLEAVDAVAGVPNCTLDIYGGGQLEDALRERISGAGLSERVRLRGWAGRDECLRAMQSSDALLFTSYGFDTQGLVLLEAAAMSLPTIYCDPDLSETVPRGAGILAGDPSVTAIAAAIRTVADHRDSLEDMVSVLRGNAIIQRQSSQTERILEIYRDLIERRSLIESGVGSAPA